MDETNSEYVDTQDVADAFGVSHRTVWLWVRSGKVRAFQPGGRKGRYRIPVGEIDRLKAASAVPPASPERRSA